MRSIFLILSLVSLGVFTSCNEQEKPKVIYNQEVDTNAKEQSTGLSNQEQSEDFQIADLPLVFGKSKYLVHPVGQVRGYNETKSSKKANYLSFTVSSYVPFELRGNLNNLMFQHIDSLQIRPLTDQKINIQSVTYLKEFADLYNKNYIVYTLFDQDTNLDGKLDASDVKSIYLSKDSGLEFLKLNPDYQEVLDWSLVAQNARLYFRCIEDVNKNGAFDKDDIIHYYYLDLLHKDFQVVSYDPLMVAQPVIESDDLDN
ncbi:hypothetical protein [Myroides sp. LJL119]